MNHHSKKKGKVIYTCLVGNYDNILQPLSIDDGFDYICFTNDLSVNSVGIWQIRPIPSQITSGFNNNTRISRYVKILPHLVLQEYNYSIYIDANLQIVDKEFYNIINKRIEEKYKICQVPHLESDCIYDEIRKAYFAGRVSWKEAKRHYQHLSKNHFPTNFGLFENNILLRKHNDKDVIEISEEWWKEYSNYSKRDQFCLMYVYWKHNYMPSFLFDVSHNARNVKCLKWINHSRVNVLDSQLARIDRNNPIRKAGRFFHTMAKNAFIYLFLSKSV